jgi:hypothetical protein
MYATIKYHVRHCYIPGVTYQVLHTMCYIPCTPLQVPLKFWEFLVFGSLYPTMVGLSFFLVCTPHLEYSVLKDVHKNSEFYFGDIGERKFLPDFPGPKWPSLHPPRKIKKIFQKGCKT